MSVKSIEGPEDWEESIGDLERDEIAVVLLFNSESDANSIRRDFAELAGQFPGIEQYTIDVSGSEELLKSVDLEDIEAPSLIAFRGSRQYGPTESISTEDLETVSDDIKSFLQSLPVSSD